MAEQLVLNARRREGCGGGGARRLRKTGAVPGVVYSDGAPAEVIQVDAHDFGMILQHHSDSMILALSIEGGEQVPVLLREVQHHPVSGDLLHADFLKISLTEKLETHVTIHLVGEAAGVKLGGVLDQSLFELQIEGLPSDIPESIDLDVSGLAVGDHLTVADIALPTGITVISEGDLSVASVLAPRLDEEPEADEGEGKADTEPEVIKTKHDTEEE